MGDILSSVFRNVYENQPMKHGVWNFLIGSVGISISLGLLWAWSEREHSTNQLPEERPVDVLRESEKPSSSPSEYRETSEQTMDQIPLTQASERVTQKFFGIQIDPETSPVQPERFRGYHTGVDFETFPEEQDEEVEVRAICSGSLVRKDWVKGYGGVLVENCALRGERVTVIYGHLALTSVALKTGDQIMIGDNIGVLGRGESEETDGERKHLHLGIHRGETIDLRGYVSTPAALTAWRDPCMYVCSERVVSEIVPPDTGAEGDARLAIPFASQAPTGEWDDPVFQNGCEEASVLMAARFGKSSTLSQEEARQEIVVLSELSRKLFGTTVDSSAEDTLRLFRVYTGRTDGKVLEKVTEEVVQAALQVGEILLIPMNGQKLYNPHFTAPGPERHMLVVIGYDPVTEEYITHDPGTRFGAKYRYSRVRLLEAMRDYLTGDHLAMGAIVSKRAISIGPDMAH